LLIWGPGHVTSGLVCAQPAAVWDLLPTCLDLAGVTVAELRTDGVSLLAAARGAEMQHPPMYWNLIGTAASTRITGKEPRWEAVRDGDWKILRQRPEQPWELYDVARDPGESRNRAADQPEIVARLAAVAQRYAVDSSRKAPHTKN
jgi:arylsulfatase A